MPDRCLARTEALPASALGPLAPPGARLFLVVLLIELGSLHGSAMTGIHFFEALFRGD